MTRLVRFTNNATSRLASGLSAIGLTMSVTPGDGAKFPVITGGQFFKATLIKVDGTKEVVKVTARTADTMTIERAHESVGGVQTAYIFSAGDKVELRLTAEALSDELDRLDAAAFLDVSNKSTNYTILESDVSKLIKTSTASGTITHTLPQISTLTGSFEVQISKETGDANLVTINRAGTDTINGLTSYNLSSQYQCVWLVADLSTNTWTAITSASATNAVVDVFVGAGSAGPFTLSGDPGTKNNTVVHVGGVYQNKATYTIVGDQLTLGGVVGVGVLVEVEWAQPMAVGTPSDGTVTPAKLADTTKAAIQSQTWTAFASAGTAPAYTLTPTPTILAYVAGQRFRMASHAAGTTGSNTLNVAGLGAKNLKQYSSAGVKEGGVVASGQLLDVEYDGTDMVILNPLPGVTLTGNQTIAGVKTFSSMPIVPTQSMVRMDTANGNGSTNTAIRRFTTATTNQGTDITYADSAANGATFTINTNGVYAISYSDSFSASDYMGISLNSAQLTTSVNTITAATCLASLWLSTGNLNGCVAWAGYLPAGSVIRAHTNNTPGNGTFGSGSHFTIARVG